VDNPDVHVVDLSVGGEGVQWASLISDLAQNGSKTFHLTALTTDIGGPGSITARWLSEFARSSNLSFQYNSLWSGKEEDPLLRTDTVASSRRPLWLWATGLLLQWQHNSDG
jgi:hypothetical protein